MRSTSPQRPRRVTDRSLPEPIVALADVVAHTVVLDEETVHEASVVRPRNRDSGGSRGTRTHSLRINTPAALGDLGLIEARR